MMPTCVANATLADIWPDGSGHPPAVEQEIIRVAREEITAEDVRRSGCTFAPWYAPYYLAEQRVQARAQVAETLQAKEVRDLRARVRRLEELLGDGARKGGPLIQAVGTALGRSVGEVRKELGARIEALESREPIPLALPSADAMTALERQRGPVVRYEGVWSAGKAYGPGAMVTKDGAAWIAMSAMAAGTKPGEGQTAWRLAVKAPQSGLAKLVRDEVRRQLSGKPGVA